MMPYEEHLLHGISLLDQEIVLSNGTAGKVHNKATTLVVFAAGGMENSLLAQHPYRIRILMA